MNLNKISVTVLTKNSEKYIKECLESVNEFGEVIILDNGSSDNTLEIAEKFENVKIFKNEFIGFGPLKNLACSFAINDWIFNLDSDETIDLSLIESIKKLDEKNINLVGFFYRKNYFKGKAVKFSGWNKDKVFRLYNRKKTGFKNVMVHESIKLNNMEVKKLNGFIKHYAVDEVTDFLKKIKRYSVLERDGLKKLSIFSIVFRSYFAFFKTYILKLGFLDGWRGILIAVSDFNGVFYKYIVKYAKSE